MLCCLVHRTFPERLVLHKQYKYFAIVLNTFVPAVIFLHSFVFILSEASRIAANLRVKVTHSTRLQVGKMAKEHVFVVYEKNEGGGIALIEAHTDNDNAKAAAKALKSKGSAKVEVKKLELKKEADATAPKETKAKGYVKNHLTRPTVTDNETSANAGKKVKSPEPEDEDEVRDDAEEEAPKAKKAAPKKAAPKKAKAVDDSRKQIPEGKEDAFEGLKVLFTGTFKIDRKTCEATAKTYGAEVIKKLEDTDYIILGTKPGQKKIDEINEKGLETITEDEFFEMLKTGVPEGKRDRMAAAAEEKDEPAPKKQKK